MSAIEDILRCFTVILLTSPTSWSLDAVPSSGIVAFLALEGLATRPLWLVPQCPLLWGFILPHLSLKKFGVDVGLNKCLINLVGLKDNVWRNAYLILTWDVPSSLVEALGLGCHIFAYVMFLDC